MNYSGRYALLALVVALTAIYGAGCGGTVIDDVKTEEALEQNVESTLGKKVDSVDCPTDVDVEPKATFECTVRLVGGKEEIAELEITDEDANVNVISLAPPGGDKPSDAGK